MFISLVWADPEAVPDCSLLELARRIELLEFVLRSAPSETVVSIASQATVGHLHRQAHARNKEHVSDSMEDDKSLCDHRKWS